MDTVTPPVPSTRRRAIPARVRSNMRIIRKVMTAHVTSDEVRIREIIKQSMNLTIGKQSVKTALNLIKEEDQLWGDELAETVYAATIHEESEEIAAQILATHARIEAADTPGEYATLVATLLKLYERRQYVMEELALYPRIIELQLAGKLNPVIRRDGNSPMGQLPVTVESVKEAAIDRSWKGS